MSNVFRCAQCGDRTVEPVVVNGIRLCEVCADDLSPHGRREGVRQPKMERHRLAREDRVRESRGW